VRDRAAAPEFSFCQPAAVRAFYFDIDFEIDENRSVALQLDRSANLLVCASFLTRMLIGITLPEAIAIAQNYDAHTLNPSLQIVGATSANAVMLLAIQIALDAQNSERLTASERELLKTLLHRLKGKTTDDEAVKQVADQAREVAKTRHHIGQEWQFNLQEKQLLKQYYTANQLLLKCLNSEACRVPPDFRQQLEATLLMPLAQ
jgi:hypothetical protein